MIVWERMRSILNDDSKGGVMGVRKGQPYHGADPKEIQDSYNRHNAFLQMIEAQQRAQQREMTLRYARDHVAREIWLLREEMIEDLIGRVG